MIATDFRIGNYLYYVNQYNYKKNILKVSGIIENGIITEDYEKYTFNNLQGIELTEDILLKCGFEKFLNQYKLKTDKVQIPFIILFLSNEFQYDDLRYSSNLKYVHQLQNLYFCLCGEELTINL